MNKKLARYWDIFWQFRRLQLSRALEYRGNFLFWSGISIMWSLFNFFFFSLIVGVRGEIGGWDIHEMYVLLSIYTIIDAFMWSFFFQNMAAYTQAIFNGGLNTLWLMPVDAQFMIMTKEGGYHQVWRFLLGVALLVWSTKQVGVTVTPWGLILFLITLIASLVLIYCLWFGLSTLAFFVDRLDNINDVIPSLRSIWQVPRSVFGGWLAIAFTYVFPLALVGSVPSEILIGRSAGPLIIWLVGSAMVVFVATRFFFHRVSRRYVGAAN